MKFAFISMLLILCASKTFGQDELKGLKSLDELQKEFNKEKGKVRIIALLSPS